MPAIARYNGDTPHMSLVIFLPSNLYSFIQKYFGSMPSTILSTRETCVNLTDITPLQNSSAGGGKFKILK